jgi:hypothetical protein
MIGHQRPGINGGLCSSIKLSHALEEVFAVGYIADNPAPFNSSHDYVM